MSLRHSAISCAFRAIAATGADRWAAGFARGRGVILTLHRVCAPQHEAFAPNRILEITPDFLNQALTLIRTLGHDLVSMDEALARIAAPADSRFFVALTLDDGFRDTLEVALPILQRHGAPATVYCVPGFIDRSAPLWWVDLEDAIRRLDRIAITLDGQRHSWPAATPGQKTAAHRRLYWMLRKGDEARLRGAVSQLAHIAGLDSRATVDRLCLDADGVRTLAGDPLITIGAHTLTHPRLACVEKAAAQAEMAQSAAVLSSLIGRKVTHFAYPVGDRTSAGPREFAMASALGFASAVTTRPGHVFADHAAHPAALPRVSLNGLHQNEAALRALLSGLPFLALNRGRRLDLD